MAKPTRFRTQASIAHGGTAPITPPVMDVEPEAGAPPRDPASLCRRRPGTEQLHSIAALIGVDQGEKGAEGAPPVRAVEARPVHPAGTGNGSSGDQIYIETADDLRLLRPGAVAHIALHLIVENPSNARVFYTSQDVDRPAMSLSENKQLAIATGWVDDGKVYLKDGQMRWRGGECERPRPSQDGDHQEAGRPQGLPVLARDEHRAQRADLPG